MKKTFLFIPTLAIMFLIGCSGSNNSNSSSGYSNSFNHEKTEEELREELKMREYENPLNYLDDEETYLHKEQKLLKQTNNATITGYIVNKANLAKFKDVTVRVTYYSQTDTEIKSEEYVIYKYFEPNSRTKISLNVKYPKAYHSFSFVVTGATPVYE